MKFERVATRIVDENAAGSAENLRGSGRTMMLNEPVAIGGSNDSARSMNVDEQRVHLHRKLKRIAKARGYLDLQEAAALREA